MPDQLDPRNSHGRRDRPVRGRSLAAVRDLVAGRIEGVSEDQAARLRLADVSHDSRDAGPGVLFAARPGERADGHDFVAAAAAEGSPAALVERRVDVDVPQLVVASVAESLGGIAAAVHGDPSADLSLLGVTGTSGKTTTTYLLESIMAASGARTGLIGTVETRVAGDVVPGVRTTPEATDLQRLLAVMVDRGINAVAMEISSHGLALGRMGGSRVRVAGFTNLSQDHLDFHPDLDAYFAAKASLFTPAYAERGVVCLDRADDAGRDWGSELVARSAIGVTTVSATGRPADVRATEVELAAGGSTFVAHLSSGNVPVRIRLPGAFNVANALLAMAMAEGAGVPADVAARGVGALSGVPGRMERVDAGQAFEVIVDYAHKPEALAQVLRTARGLTDGRVIVVLGCGGNRDVGKRPVMGELAARLSDVAVLTSDNPRSEDPLAILAAMRAGVDRVPGARFMVEPDRRLAIGEALDAAGPGDVVVIAGKGHETYQELAEATVAFDDRAVARAHLQAGGPM